MKTTKQLLKDKKGFNFSSAFYALISISIIVVAIGVWVGEWSADYDSGLNYDLSEYNKLDNLSTEAQSQQQGVVIKSSAQDDSFEGTSIRGVFGILNNIYEPFRLLFGEGGMLDSLTDRFGIPNYIRQGFVTIIVMAITFSLVIIFFRLPRRKV